MNGGYFGQVNSLRALALGFDDFYWSDGFSGCAAIETPEIAFENVGDPRRGGQGCDQ